MRERHTHARVWCTTHTRQSEDDETKDKTQDSCCTAYRGTEEGEIVYFPFFPFAGAAFGFSAGFSAGFGGGAPASLSAYTRV